MKSKFAALLNKWRGSKEQFSSKEYWENRYKQSGNSGSGSYKHLAAFKADVLNKLFDENKFADVIEFGCGDGNQLGMLKINKYIGLDVSITVLEQCFQKYASDTSKSFFLYNHHGFVDNQGIFKCDCAISLDVLYHLVEKEVYEDYLKHLFGSAKKMVIIYAANLSLEQKTQHELYREFTKDIEKDIVGWQLKEVIKNKYPAVNYEDQKGSLADFFIYVPVS
jgi:hypothetical protein